MPSAVNEFAFDFDIMRAAARNYRKCEPDRKRKMELVDQGKYAEAEGKERIASRVNRLITHLQNTPAASRKSLPKGVRAIIDKGGVSEAEVDNELLERIIGATRDFLAAAFFEQGVRANRSVGRIVTRMTNGRVSYGTGFLVSPRLLLTNWHVLKTADDASRSVVEFDYQLDAFGNAMKVDRYTLDPDSFFLNLEGLDFALAAVVSKSEQGGNLNERGFHRLIKEQGKVALGIDCLNIIQHPLGEMKQIVIRENKLVDLPKDPAWAAHYEGDTEPGSSGSPVFNDQWEVIALHHSGVPKTDAKGNFLDRKGKIWRKGDDPAQLAWEANEGVRVTSLVDYLSKVKVRKTEKALLQELLDQKVSASTQDPVEGKQSPQTTALGGASISSSIALAGGPFAVTIPLQITISLGTPGASPLTLSAVHSPNGEDFGEKIEIDPNYENRAGYDPDFLGFPVPLPKLTSSIKAQAAKLNGSTRIELKYNHYSVIMNGKRRVAFVSAVNFNAEPKFTHKREDGGEKWGVDPRISADQQSRESNYANPDIDRGHLTRRADAGWGSTAKQAKLANDDTFHFTNCSPQHEIFNQSSLATKNGLLLWGNLENHVARQAKQNRKKISIFNGPVFRTNDRNINGLQVPKEFFKLIVFENDAGKPRALAFLLSQLSLIKDLPEEEFEIGPYQPFQVRISEIEAKTKLNFGALQSFDPLDVDEHENLFESGTQAVALESLGDIVF